MSKDPFSTGAPVITPANPSPSFSGSTDLFSAGGPFGEAYGEITKYLFMVIGATLFLYIVWGGIKYITSSGDEAKATEARATIINGVIGTAIFIGIYTIMSIGMGLGRTVNTLPKNEIEFKSSPTPTPR